MTVTWNHETNGAITLYIDGDLQFDSRDERIYHECLALPALAVAKQRTAHNMKAMIAGGADGLTARELLKDGLLRTIDLIDYDPIVINLSKAKFSQLNQGSLVDPRLQLHIQDAWKFAETAIAAGGSFDLIVSDLTVPSDLESARMHSIEWYEMLAKLCGNKGVIAANCVSPSATPRAYWSVIHSMRQAGLHTLPYRVFIPSFKALGYGDDWGFILASPQPISLAELTNMEAYAQPRFLLNHAEQIKTLCTFPEELLYYSWQGQPAHESSDILVHYLFNDQPLNNTSGCWNSLTADWQTLQIPQAESKACLLPPEIRDALADDSIESEESLFHRVVSLVPSLRRFQTRAMISEFLKAPHVFLDAIDLGGLVERLLARAADLPKRLVTELQLLRDRLLEWGGDYRSLLVAGSRLLAIVAVVVIIGNLMYPDSAYAKGGHPGAHANHGGEHGDHVARGEHGEHGDRGDHRVAHNDRFNHNFGDHYDHYGHWGRYNHWNRFSAWNHHWGYDGWARTGWYGGGWGGWYVPNYAAGNGFVNLNLDSNNATTVDEEGNNYPARKYNTAQIDNDANYYENSVSPPAQIANSQMQSNPSNYRLGPDTDVIAGGKVVMHLTDNSYMLLAPDKTLVMDQQTGKPIMSLYADPSVLSHVHSELARQTHGLEAALESKQNSMHWADSTQMSGNSAAGGAGNNNETEDTQSATDSENEIKNMQATLALLKQASCNLGSVPPGPQKPAAAPMDGAVELFAGTWLTPDSNYVIVKRPDGSFDYLNNTQWFSDEGKTPMQTPFPRKFKEAVVAYINGMVKESDAAQADMMREKQEASDRLTALHEKLQDLEQPAGNSQQTAGTANESPATGGATQLAENVKGGPENNNRDPEESAQPTEATRRLKMAIRRTHARLAAVDKQLAAMPQEVAVAKKSLTVFQ